MEGLTEEQQLFADMGEAFVNELVAQSRMFADTPGDTWRRLCELGMPMALAPQSEGGFGGGAVESFIMGWIQGRGLPDTPLVPSAIASTALVVSAPASPPRSELIDALVSGRASLAYAHYEGAVLTDPCDLWLRTKLVASDAANTLVGEKICVLGAPLANGFLVTARCDAGLALVYVPADASNVEIVAQQLVDGRSAAIVRFHGVRIAEGQVLTRTTFDAGPIRNAQLYTTVALIGEAVGALEQALRLASDHISTREQFGGPLSRFQVLRHRVADIFMVVRELEAIGLRAARAIDLGLEGADNLVRSAKIHVGLSGVKAAEQCVQLHGAMGITEEVDVGRCLKRLITVDCLFGNARQHLEHAADELQAELQGA